MVLAVFTWIIQQSVELSLKLSSRGRRENVNGPSIQNAAAGSAVCFQLQPWNGRSLAPQQPKSYKREVTSRRREG